MLHGGTLAVDLRMRISGLRGVRGTAVFGAFAIFSRPVDPTSLVRRVRRVLVILVIAALAIENVFWCLRGRQTNGIGDSDLELALHGCMASIAKRAVTLGLLPE